MEICEKSHTSISREYGSCRHQRQRTASQVIRDPAVPLPFVAQEASSSHEALVGPVIGQLKRMVEVFGLRDGNGALRVATALDEAIQNAILHGNLEVSSKLREDEDGSVYVRRTL